MGDSLTEGVGCYDYTKMSDTSKTYHELPPNEFQYQLNRFHEQGWPNRLGNKLNYDRVINLGWGGSSNCAHLKLFVEKILDKDFSKYDVLVVWLLSDPVRFSFYTDYELWQYNPAMDEKYTGPLERGYLESIKEMENSSIIETIFYIKCFEQICENKNFNLQITSWEKDSLDKIFKIHQSKYEMKSADSNYIALDFFENEDLKSKVCFHPNERGYELIAENMYKSIKRFNSHLINKNKVQQFTWSWEASPINWKSHFHNI